MTVSVEQTTVIRGEGFIMLRPAPPPPVSADLRSTNLHWDPTPCERFRDALRKLVYAMDLAEEDGYRPFAERRYTTDAQEYWFEPLREARKLLQER